RQRQCREVAHRRCERGHHATAGLWSGRDHGWGNVGRQLHPAFSASLYGIAPSENTAAWDGRGTFRITGPIGAPDGLGIAAAFERERSIYPDLQKVTIPGPSEITTMLEPREAARAAWPTVVELIRAELRTLIEVGARDIQLDVPQIAMGLADRGW